MASVARPLSIPLPNGARLHLISLVPFGLIHVAALGIFFLPFKWSYLITAFALYEVRMFFVTAGYHRYFSHRSFKTSRWFQFVIAWMAMSSTQKGVLWWAAHHRHHHRYSDLEEDLHSPTLFGFWWSHIGWILSDRYNDTRYDYIGDFAKFPELRWHNNYHYFMASARQGFYWWEIDLTYYGLKLLSWFRLVRELRRVPDHVLAEGQAFDASAAIPNSSM